MWLLVLVGARRAARPDSRHTYAGTARAPHTHRDARTVARTLFADRQRPAQRNQVVVSAALCVGSSEAHASSLASKQARGGQRSARSVVTLLDTLARAAAGKGHPESAVFVALRPPQARWQGAGRAVRAAWCTTATCKGPTRRLDASQWSQRDVDWPVRCCFS